jgi:hypothetical protein
MRDRKRKILSGHAFTYVIASSSESEGWTGLVYVKLIMRFYLNYSMLVVNSFGLQNALERASLDVAHFFGRCYTSAKTCAIVIRDELGPQGYLRYAPDSHFVLTSYAVLTLLKARIERFHRTLIFLFTIHCLAHTHRVPTIYGRRTADFDPSE